MTSTRQLLSRSALGLAAAATLTLAACSAGTEPAAGSASSAAASGATSAAPSTESPVTSSLEMSATTSGSTSSASSSSPLSSSAPSSSAAADAVTHNDADVAFLQMMLPHHRGAIEMAQLAPSRAADAQVKELAAQIEAAQAPEIEQITSWLQAWGSPVDSTAAMTDMGAVPSTDGATGGMDHGGMDHGGTTTGQDGGMGSATGTTMAMSGEMTAEQMSALQASTGAEFDRMFLEMMIEHHAGAVQMAQTELDAGVNPDALALAESIKASQAAEIATMQQLLQTS